MKVNVDKIVGLLTDDRIVKIEMAIVVALIMVLIVKKLLKLGRQVLMGMLIIVFVFTVTPKINVFLVNQLGQYGVIEKTLSRIVDSDIETKVKREYEQRTGQEIHDEGQLAKLKTDSFSDDPEIPDELNIILNAGLPQGINNTLLNNFSNLGTSSIRAASFPDYVSKFFVARIITLLSICIAVSVAIRVFNDQE